MDTSIATAVIDILRTSTPDERQRQVILHRLTDMCAAGEAGSSLRMAAARARDAAKTRDVKTTPEGGNLGQLLADTLSAASALWDGGAVQAGTVRGLPTAAAELGRVASRAVEGQDETDARTRLARATTSPALITLVRSWVKELRQIAAERPSTGACTVATAMNLWMWTAQYAGRERLPGEAVATELVDAFCWLAAARCQIVSVVRDPQMASGTGADVPQFFSDLCHVQAARSSGAAATICTELVFGYRRHPAWDPAGCAACYRADDLDDLEGLIPGIASSAPPHIDIIEADGSHAAKAGPCATFDGVDTFTRLRTRLDACLTGARLTKDRAAAALPRVMTSVTATR